jgi:hypothetical protein
MSETARAWLAVIALFLLMWLAAAVSTWVTGVPG